MNTLVHKISNKVLIKQCFKRPNDVYSEVGPPLSSILIRFLLGPQIFFHR